MHVRRCACAPCLPESKQAFGANTSECAQGYAKKADGLEDWPENAPVAVQQSVEATGKILDPVLGANKGGPVYGACRPHSAAQADLHAQFTACVVPLTRSFVPHICGCRYEVCFAEKCHADVGIFWAGRWQVALV